MYLFQATVFTNVVQDPSGNDQRGNAHTTTKDQFFLKRKKQIGSFVFKLLLNNLYEKFT